MRFPAKRWEALSCATPMRLMRPPAHSMLRSTLKIQQAVSCPAHTRLCISVFPPHPGSVTIPSNALLFRAEGLRVGVVRNGHVELTPISIGQDYGSTVEVISGLSARDTVIVNPFDSLANGAAVQLVAKNANGARQ